MRAEPHWCVPPGDVRPRLEPRQRRPGHGARVARRAEEDRADLPRPVHGDHRGEDLPAPDDQARPLLPGRRQGHGRLLPRPQRPRLRRGGRCGAGGVGPRPVPQGPQVAVQAVPALRGLRHARPPVLQVREGRQARDRPEEDLRVREGRHQDRRARGVEPPGRPRGGGRRHLQRVPKEPRLLHVLHPPRHTRGQMTFTLIFTSSFDFLFLF